MECDQDELDWPASADPIHTALLPLIEVIFEATAEGSPERARAMSELLAAATRIRDALVRRSRMN
jgi:hypothetical protein